MFVTKPFNNTESFPIYRPNFLQVAFRKRNFRNFLLTYVRAAPWSHNLFHQTLKYRLYPFEITRALKRTLNIYSARVPFRTLYYKTFLQLLCEALVCCKTHIALCSAQSLKLNLLYVTYSPTANSDNAHNKSAPVNSS